MEAANQKDSGLGGVFGFAVTHTALRYVLAQVKQVSVADLLCIIFLHHPIKFKTCQNQGAVNQRRVFSCQDFIEFLLTSFEEAAPTATWTLTSAASWSLYVAIAMAASMVTLGARAFQKC